MHWHERNISNLSFIYTLNPSSDSIRFYNKVSGSIWTWTEDRKKEGKTLPDY